MQRFRTGAVNDQLKNQISNVSRGITNVTAQDDKRGQERIGSVSDSLSDINKKLNPMSILSKQSLGRTTMINSQQSTVKDVNSPLLKSELGQKSVAFQPHETNNDA